MTLSSWSLGLAMLPLLAVQAHMEMKNPLPLRSKFDTQNTGDGVDYNMMRPLASDGSNFPCFNYHTYEDQHTTATYKAGGTYNLEIAGEATHDGGSCQISLSYDNGATFQVIKSMIGNCPVQKTWDFTIPRTVPAQSDALLAWTWFNKLGNREMYMNCARVQIQNPFGDYSKQAFAEKLPALFTANIYGDTCQIDPGTEVSFPNPGDDSVNPKGLPPTTMKGCPASSGPSQKAPAVSSVAAPLPDPSSVESVEGSDQELPSAEASASSARIVPTSTSASVEPTVTASPEKPVASATGGSSSVAPIPTVSSEGCTPGTIFCGPDGSTWSFCTTARTATDMGNVARGMICKDGLIIRAE